MKRLRKILFWAHLVLGLAACIVIAIVAFTGASMAFEKQIVGWAERGLRRVTPPSADAKPLPIQELLKRVREKKPDTRPQSYVVSSDPAAAVIMSLGRTGSLYVDPYTGEAKPQGAKPQREFFQLMLRWHRWLGVAAPPQNARPAKSPDGPPPRPAASNTPVSDENTPRAAPGFNLRNLTSTIVGCAAIVFFTLCVSGLYLWWPRAWSLRTLKPIATLNFKLSGKARDWNWHNVIGLWSSPVLIVITFTGAVMAFRPFGDWIYPRVEGAAPGGPSALAISTPPPGTRPLGPDALLAIAQNEIPGWETITLRTVTRQRGGPRPGTAQAGDHDASNQNSVTPSASPESAPAPRPDSGSPSEGAARPAPQPVAVTVHPRDSWSPLDVQLQLDPYTGAVLRKETPADYGFRRAFRTLNKSIHTGEAAGIAGQSLTFLGALGALFLVYTGFALSWRRFFGRQPAATIASRR